MRRLIFLIGMPGAGKTWYGAAWARQHGWQHTDLDRLLEEREGRTVAQLFSEEGEGAFRRLERALLQEVIRGTAQDAIISCGGGTPVYEDNLAQMKAAGCVVYLQADIARLIAQLRQSQEERPLLKGDTGARLQELLSARAAIYGQAHHIVPAGTITDATFAEILTACTNRRL